MEMIIKVQSVYCWESQGWLTGMASLKGFIQHQKHIYSLTLWQILAGDYFKISPTLTYAV